MKQSTVRFLCVLSLLAVIVGCRGKSGPPQAGGKPITHWLDAVHDPDVKVRAEAAMKLGNAGAVDPRVLPALIDMLADATPEVRHAAMDGIVKFGPAGKDAKPALELIQSSDPDPDLRALATRILQRIQSPPP